MDQPISIPQGYESELWRKAWDIHSQIITLDTHADTPMAYIKKPFDLSQLQSKGHVDIPRLKAGRLNAQFFVAYTPSQFTVENGATERGQLILDTIHQIVKEHSQNLELARSSADIRKIASTNKIAIAIGMENGEPIAGDLNRLQKFYDEGVRYLTLTHWLNNHICDSSTDDQPRWGGLSPFGKEAVKACNELGVMIDVSHTHDNVVEQCLELSSAPIVATHSNAFSLCDHPRNLNDDLIKAIIEIDGVIQVNFYPSFLDQEYSEYQRKMESENRGVLRSSQDEYKIRNVIEAWQRDHPPPSRPSLEIVLDHLQYIVDLTGSADHVGFGSDFDGISSTPDGLNDVSDLPKLTYHLLKRGFSQADIQKIWGENFLRVMKKVEERAN